MEPYPEEIWNITEGNADFDIDQMIINLRVSQNINATLRRFVGNSVTIATSRRRFHEAGYDALVLSYNPAIITTLQAPDRDLKEAICLALSQRGYIIMTVEATDDVEHLTKGQTKVVPVETFVSALMAAGVVFIRVAMFGMKQKIGDFPVIPDDILECDATNHGYPLNQWDNVLKVVNRQLLPHTTQIKPYVMFTPFDRRQAPHANHGGKFTLKMANPNGQPHIVKVKVYSLLFHFLRAFHQFKFQSPISLREGIKYILHASEVFTSMEEHPDVLGGLRVETTIGATLLSQAWEIFENEQPNNIRQFIHPATLTVRAMTTLSYLVYGRELLTKMRNKFRENGITNRHDNTEYE